MPTTLNLTAILLCCNLCHASDDIQPDEQRKTKTAVRIIYVKPGDFIVKRAPNTKYIVQCQPIKEEELSSDESSHEDQ